MSNKRSIVIESGEAMALIEWLKGQEKMLASKGGYTEALHCKERAKEIEDQFWPRGEWETAWAGKGAVEP